MTPEEIDAAVAAMSSHVVGFNGELWWCSCSRLGGSRLGWNLHIADVGLAAAEEARLASGVERVGYGRKTDGSDLIYPVSDTEYGRRLATHTRRVVVWPEEGPSDNWARYNGPWVQIGGPFS